MKKVTKRLFINTTKTQEAKFKAYNAAKQSELDSRPSSVYFAKQDAITAAQEKAKEAILKQNRKGQKKW